MDTQLDKKIIDKFKKRLDDSISDIMKDYNDFEKMYVLGLLSEALAYYRRGSVSFNLEVKK